MSQSGTASHIKYRPDIDGLRAIAVLAVLFFHAFPQQFPSGFIGVDIFFVISGYLISSIIFDGLQADAFSYGDFYSRRIRRIFPALAIVLLCTLVFGWIVLMPDEFRQLGKHVVGGAGFASNIVLLRESGYFDLDAKFKPLLHLWSLGIEEQYYLIWPGVLYLCRGRRRATFLALGGLGITSFLTNLHFTRSDPDWAYYLPLTRFFELMVGSGLAFALRGRHGRPAATNSILPYAANLKSIAGIVALTVSFVFINERQAFPGWWGLLVSVGTLLLVDAGMGAWFNSRVLACRPMVGLGLISYPLYLWHWPILSYGFIVLTEPTATFRLAALAASVLLAWGTYRLLEIPLRRRSTRLGARHVVITLSAAMVLLAMIGMLARLQFLRPLSARDPRNVEISDAKSDRVFEETGVVEGNTGRAAIFIGDSHMQQYWSRILYAARQPGRRRTVEMYTRGGCAPFPKIQRATFPKCLQLMTAAFARAEQPDVDVVVLAGSWKGYVERGDYFLPGVKGAADLDVLAPQNQWIYDGLAEEMARLRALGKRVVIFTSSPRGYVFDPARMVDRSELVPRPKNIAPVSLVQLRAVVAPIDGKIRAAAEKAGAEIVDPDIWMCTLTECPVTNDQGWPLYSDGTHIRATVAQERATGLDQYVLVDSAADRPGGT